MYSVTVRGHMMIAHSFRGGVFGPAQQLHGATYIVDAEFASPTLDANGIVVDIGLAGRIVNATLGELSYRNLDELPEFTGVNTTTEFLARAVFDRIAAAIGRGELGESSGNVTSLRVTLHESHLASASFEGPIPAAS
jgi:6-pyruvoyl-tetrahydropterin synthase